MQTCRNHSCKLMFYCTATMTALAIVSFGFSSSTVAAEKESAKDKGMAPSAEEMKPYTEKIANTEVTFDMVPIPGGTFTMGSPEDEVNRSEDEGPQFEVKLEPFWMGKHEVTWDEYDIWTFDRDIELRKLKNIKANEQDLAADAVTRPTPPYTDMTFEMGHLGYPAISMTQLAAKQYCEWLSVKTGHYYRLPTEAEWEYACRAGTTTAYSFGDDAEKIDDYAWHSGNSKGSYHKVGEKKPNPWGLHDMHGNVSEWVLDQYRIDSYSKSKKESPVTFPLVIAMEEYPRVVRGGSWDVNRKHHRSAKRFGSEEDWKGQDPQFPQSVWYHTDALHVGFRLVRPLKVPSEKERKKLQLDPIVPDIARIKKRE